MKKQLLIATCTLLIQPLSALAADKVETQRITTRTNIKLPMAVSACGAATGLDLLTEKVQTRAQFSVTYCTKFQTYTADVIKGKLWQKKETNQRDVAEHWNIENEIVSVDNQMDNLLGPSNSTVEGAIINGISNIGVIQRCEQQRSLIVQQIQSNNAAGSANPCIK